MQYTIIDLPLAFQRRRASDWYNMTGRDYVEVSLHEQGWAACEVQYAHTCARMLRNRHYFAVLLVTEPCLQFSAHGSGRQDVTRRVGHIFGTFERPGQGDSTTGRLHARVTAEWVVKKQPDDQKHLLPRFDILYQAFANYIMSDVRDRTELADDCEVRLVDSDGRGTAKYRCAVDGTMMQC